ncbi:hypothetical protein GCM10009716_18020 [Streptomyces sodiiphilus]|uniref:HTH cro/C1-type domain-containing protein n=2 Tax=Streptomyces sodiiphilus TaxID=226217 RepID=A0ABN2NZS2_9ACTN
MGARAQGWAEVGERIAEARHAAGMSQGDLAEQVGLDRTMVVRMESGRRRITALELFRLAEALDVPVAHLVSRPPEALVSRRRPLEEHADDASRARFRLDARLEEHARNARWLVSGGFTAPPDVRQAGSPGFGDPRSRPAMLAQWSAGRMRKALNPGVRGVIAR